MGRLGGGELSYASDIDVLFVYDGDERRPTSTTPSRSPTRLVQRDRRDHRRGPDVPHRRPPAARGQAGPAGPLARRLPRATTSEWGLTWEFQALTKARLVAGDADARRALLRRSPSRFVYREPFPDDDVREVRRMKARIERERIPPGEDPQFHLKLGRGSLSDVEFTVQLLQLVHGGDAPRPAGAGDDRRARARSARRGLLDADDADVLEEAYRFCERARNAATC